MANSALKVKEIAKAKGITMADIAHKLKISPVNLSASLNGNPTLSRLQEVAEILGCSVSEFFDAPPKEVWGHLDFNGRMYRVESLDDLLYIANSIKAQYEALGLPIYQKQPGD